MTRDICIISYIAIVEILDLVSMRAVHICAASENLRLPVECVSNQGPRYQESKAVAYFVLPWQSNVLVIQWGEGIVRHIG